MLRYMPIIQAIFDKISFSKYNVISIPSFGAPIKVYVENLRIRASHFRKSRIQISVSYINGGVLTWICFDNNSMLIYARKKYFI